MSALLVVLPLIGALIAWVTPSNRVRPVVLPLIGVLDLAVAVAVIADPPPPSPGGWIYLDPLGAIVLLCVSILFTICAVYAVGYLAYRQERSNRILCMGLLVCLFAMNLVTVSQHLGLFWVALETTTVSMAPLIYFNRNARSIEATWKYLLICSVGIALALLGLLFLAYSTYVATHDATLLLRDILGQATRLDHAWLHAAVIFLLVGFGTKMGLAPLHAWKPDAYGEAPGLVGALLAGGLVNCAFLGIIRVYQVCHASGAELPFFQRTLVVMGLVSMAFAAVFMARQADFKRMLAYSSVEHVGILAIGLGLGNGLALWGSLFHLINNGLTKGVLFLSSGNIHRSYGSKTTEVVSGALTRLPWSGWLFLLGFIAITGSPPFSPFVSEFSIASHAFATGRPVVGSLFLLLLTIVFIGMASTVLPLVMGKPAPDLPASDYRDRLLTVAPPLVALLTVFILGVAPPPPILALLEGGRAILEGRP